MTASEAAALAASTRAALSSAAASEVGSMGGESSNSHTTRGTSLGASYIHGEDGAARSYRDMLQKSTRILKTAGQSFGESALTPMGRSWVHSRSSTLTQLDLRLD